MSASTKKTILSAATPTSQLTLGNYIGAIRNWVHLHEEFDGLFFVADLHALTSKQDPTQLTNRTREALALYLASGIDPKKALVFVQSQVPQHAELAWVLTCHTYMGELSRMTQYKDKSSKAGQNIGAGIFTYPALMAADILLYQTDLVPVGADQKQHIELARDLAERMNSQYGEGLLKVPAPHIVPLGAKIMSLQEPTLKMSKSDPNPNATVFLNDSPDTILKRVKRAVTDSGSEITDDDSKPGVKNLLTIQSVLTGKPISEIVESYLGKQYGHLKVGTAEVVIESLKPIQSEWKRWMDDPAELSKVAGLGAARARESAQYTLDRVYDKIGIARF